MSAKFAVFREVPGGKPVVPRSLWEAAELGSTAYITRMVERAIELDINEKDRLGRTPLMWAAEMGHAEAAKALVDYGSDVTVTECNNRTAVHLAARSGNTEVLAVLFSKLSPEEKVLATNTPDKFGITPVFLAAQKMEEGRLAFEMLIQLGGRYK